MTPSTPEADTAEEVAREWFESGSQARQDLGRAAAGACVHSLATLLRTQVTKAVEAAVPANCVVIERIAECETPVDYSGISDPLHMLRLRDRQISYLRRFWIRDCKDALAGKPQALRTRIELAESGPVDWVQSDLARSKETGNAG